MKSRIDLESVFKLSELADYIVPFAIRVVCDLRIADLLVAGPRPVVELAAESGTHAPSLQRALRALASKGIFAETDDGDFELTPLAEPLRGDHPLSLREAFPLLPGEIKAWSNFDHTIRTGRSAFEEVHGTSCWDYLERHPEEGARWLRSQQAATALESRSLLSAYPWARFGTVADLGGGNGAFLASLLGRFPEMRGVLFDLPHAARNAPAALAEAGVADRCEVVQGSFLEDAPGEIDLYLLKRVLYGLDDEQAGTALRNVRTAMKPDSRLLVLEPVIEAGNREDVGKLYDLLLITMTGAGARTEEQFASLTAAAGLRVVSFIPTPMLKIVEIAPA
ncbi:methyltransferase [Amycolatopsis sp. NPDC004079]|uniref:methyltransferase n=1 Tax=Amycolatopsis sp. NPDC004079 TaxID=3154549 RepID=UPI0033AF197C